ncbi:hypothetical protein R3P38DRAFT_2597717 [Favolaschia claudopus]|uniref:Uncharacterized protein n=1 Tax=Favolaschia claudopus TaxID=2862362 RepID=A0AAW0E6W5_9AGAR
MNENRNPVDLKHLDIPKDLQMDPARMLISPPPEEELRILRTANQQPKRKRGGIGTPSKQSMQPPPEPTPNPKPRKSHRRRTSDLEQESPTRMNFGSPHPANPNADWVPPPRRSVSVTPYEPPTDVFTPPKEVFLAPTPSKKTTSKAKGKPRSTDGTKGKRAATPSGSGSRQRTATTLRVVVHSVKKEPLPPIDLARPMTPPSPTDDPLLLLPSSSPIKARSSRSSPSATSSNASPQEQQRSSDADYAPIDWTADNDADIDPPTTDSMDLDLPASFDGPLPSIISTAPPLTASWADSDTDTDDDAGMLPISAPTATRPFVPTLSFTSAASLPDATPTRASIPLVFNNTYASPTRARTTTPPPATPQQSYTQEVTTVYTLPTKPDPPTPHTKARADKWGVWGSPWPGRGPSEAGEGSFRMDGRSLLRGSAEASSSYPSDEARLEADDYVHEQHQEEDDDEDSADEGVSFLRALREEDAQIRERRSGSEEDENDEEEEAEVRAMSVDPELEEEEDDETTRISFPRAPFRFPSPEQQPREQTTPTRNLVFSPPPPVVHGPARVQTSPEDQQRRSTPPVLHAVGTHVPVPSTPTRGGAPRVSFAKGLVPVEDVELVHATVEDHVDADAEEDDDDDEDDEEDSALLGMVKITSADPRAAARAAAILKQHDYDCFTRLRLKDTGNKRRRHSYAGVSKAMPAPVSPRGSRTPGPHQSARGKMQDIAELKAAAVDEEEMEMEKQKKRRQSTPARVVGERVYFPGSPAPVTTTQLLEEAEREVVSRGVVSPSREGSISSLSNALASGSASASASGSGTTSRRASARGVPLPESDDDESQEEEEQISSTKNDEREWTKADWKVLDACFTDERIAVAQRLGMVLNLSPAPPPKTVPFPSTPVRNAPANVDGPAVMMASADAVDLAKVVERFVGIMGGEQVVKTWGETWDGENLTRRARALQNKQRAGNVAPPTPGAVAAATPAKSETKLNQDDNVFSRRRASMVVPDFTPLGKRAMPPRMSAGRAMVNTSSPLSGRPSLPPPVGLGAPFSNLPPTPEGARRRRVPGSLFAPRYSHLLEEAEAVAAGPRCKPVVHDDDDDAMEDGEAQAPEDEDATENADADDAEMAPATPLREREARLHHKTRQPAEPATIGGRVKGFIFSYLPTMAKTAPPPTRRPAHAGPRLPLPPLELLEKQRGPVTTPARPPLPKTRAPKELVNLQPAPPQKPKSFLPRRAPPKRLVDLNHVDPPVEEAPKAPVPFVRPRTSSGNSVKDLVKNFEALDGAKKGAAEIKRVRSVGECGKKAGTSAGAGRPMWRP